MSFTDGQIAPCIQCGTQTIAREVHANGKRQILAVCNDCLDRARYAESIAAARRALAHTVNSLERMAVGDPLSGEDVYSVLEPAGDEDWESVDDSWDLESEE